MYNLQANNARYIYTLSSEKKERDAQYTNVPYVRLKNGLYFTKEAKSDEKLIITEHDITSIIRTILFIHMFHVEPNENIAEIISTGHVKNLTNSEYLHTYRDIADINEAIEIVDILLGDGFCSIARRPFTTVYREYLSTWRHHIIGVEVALPSARDYTRLYHFFNIINHHLSPPSRFVLANETDNKIWLQNNEKWLY